MKRSLWRIMVAFWIMASGAAAGSPDGSGGPPDCFGPGHWAANMALAQLLNRHIVGHDDTLADRTTSTLLAAQEIGPDRYRQVTDVHFVRRDGSDLEAITISETSREECSMGDVRVLVVQGAAR